MKTFSVLVLLTAGLSGAASAQETWTGAYAGLSAGYAKADFGWDNLEVDTAEVPAEGDGATFGLRAGYDQQFGQTVVGGFAEYGKMDISGTGVHSLYPTDNVEYTVEDYLLVGARAGRLVGGALVYGTGGVAVSELQTTYTNPRVFVYEPERLVGFMVGVGYERMLTTDWSVMTELRYVDFKEQARDPVGNTVRNEIGYETTSLIVGLHRRF
ncbi:MULTISPECIES: outer membrane protein [unclassified Yoonia]|uniref:outer membrane protein n=1 Tax=unclassified Yoonia TaxID=2629118 RepID=UPI002AFF51A0|nr:MULTISPECIES: outer membrane beta-barrel protein [unclassified Yoonia]